MKIPCAECLCYIMCKTRLFNNLSTGSTGSISGMARRENCNRLKQFFHMSDQDNINEARILFNLKPYK